MKRKNKKGWIRIVEAFVAILLVAGILLIVIGEDYLRKEDISSDIYDSQLAILRDIQLDDGLRQSVLNAITPVESSEGAFPSDVKDRIALRTLNYLECQAKICEMDAESCNLNNPPEKDIYVQSVAITVTETQEEAMDPKQLKLFCWMK